MRPIRFRTQPRHLAAGYRVNKGRERWKRVSRVFSRVVDTTAVQISFALFVLVNREDAMQSLSSSLSFLKTLFFLLLSSCRRGESLHAESINDHCIFTLYRYKVPMRSVFESRFRQSTKSLSSFAFSFEILLFFQQSKLQNFLSLVEYIYQSRDMIYRRVA